MDPKLSFFIETDLQKTLLDTYRNGLPINEIEKKCDEYVYFRIFEYISDDIHGEEILDRLQAYFVNVSLEHFRIVSNNKIPSKVYNFEKSVRSDG